MTSMSPPAALRTERTLEIPSQISATTLGFSQSLFIGSVDGTVREYDTTSWKVIKAIRGLGDEVSSICALHRNPNHDIWVACGFKAYCFSMDSSNLILTPSDAKHNVSLCAEDDILNELDLNSKETALAFTTDSGTVGVLDLSTLGISTMKTRHESICGTVKFIPDRPRELVSGGYDTAILHFDFEERNLLSRRDITNQLSSEGMSMSPPFIMSTAMSETGVLAAGTADGHLWLGFGGEKLHAPAKGSGPKAKRSRKWDGLQTDQEVLVKAAEAPIVALTFSEPSVIFVSTLEGTLIRFAVARNESLRLLETWRQPATSVRKVNTIVFHESRILLGGVGHNGKGCLEVLVDEHAPQATTS